MELFLVPLINTSDFNYSMSNCYEDEDNISGIRTLRPKNSIPIVDCTIKTSIYSPIVVDIKVSCPKVDGKFTAPNSTQGLVPYYNIFGIGMFDDFQLGDTYKLSKWNANSQTRPSSANGAQFDADENDEDKLELPYCLLSNRPNQFVPFVLVKIMLTSKPWIYLTLVEKRSLSLALCHKFDVITQKSGNDIIKNVKSAYLSISEIIERLSVIPENEDEKVSDTSLKNIVNFSAAGINRDKDKGPTDPKEQREHCAFLSRFVAPSSQSRLSIIYSLARKYGYGLVYRPRSHQYYAIDLLSSTAPGHPTGKPTLYVSPDCYTFGDEDDKYYYGEYSVCNSDSNIQLYFKEESPPSFCSSNPHLQNNLSGNIFEIPEKNTNSNFFDFFVSRLLKNCDHSKLLEVNLGQSTSTSYQYLFRYSPLFFSLEGASKQFYEDEVRLDFVELHKGKCGDPALLHFNTVNSRLAYAQVKKDFMNKNVNRLDLEFYNVHTRPNHITNLVYEVMNRIGYSTTLFAEEKILKFFNETYQNNQYDRLGSIFGKVIIKIESLEQESGKRRASARFPRALTEYASNGRFANVNRNVHRRSNRISGSRFSINVSMYFYSDILGYNFDYE